MAAQMRSLACPVTTWTRQGWMLTPVAANRAMSNIDSTVARGTGVGRNALTLRRDRMAHSTALRSASASIAGGVSLLFICHSICLQRQQTQATPLHGSIALRARLARGNKACCLEHDN